MGYLYENSSPERFQQLCQSLLAATFPKLQCLPVGQPDGGRDGWDPETKTVLQVKFKRADDPENAAWLIATLETERPKILRLAQQGATNYIIATNARGTAHPESGRIDVVQAWLDENLPIPAVCFWRDELDRRLDDASLSLKLKYAELLSLEDGIEVALSSVFGSSRERQQDAVRAFLAAQFEADQAVKFKQVNLSNDLLDLFIDVPIGFPRKVLAGPGRGASRSALESVFAALMGVERLLFVNDHAGKPEVVVQSPEGRLRRLNLGAAELLLGSQAQEHLKLVVLEGAPGQGKSTLAQYVCQVHRARYLNKEQVLARVPVSNQQTSFRVPIKVDLRDYAAFLDGHSPFASTASQSDPRTLDVFLAQLISYNSGGLHFSTHDVLSLLKSAPSLLFLDGLDEVADVVAREALVGSIGEALARWREFDSDLQVVVTSRPSVFGRAPSFDRLGFVTLTLEDIDRGRISDYTERWVIARGLDDSEKQDVRKILAEKLELAHIRDLTRNPMQLTILLSLIHQIGHSLPDQRTDLYERYVDLFLTREADKSVRVRENRVVLLGFIQHLAWVLQTQAESSKTAGSITAVELQEMASAYLQAGGHSIQLAEDLFGGGLERIFVLVERIEGLYEFEVQPLREFYCAQYLYSTAPVGTYRDKVLRGDRAQRFEALASNPFWLNVCRFYAGSCERGETGTLVLSLEELINTGDLDVASHARRVGLALLQDWVFSNVKYAQDQLIRAVFDDDGTQLLIAGEGRLVDELLLDPDCGRNTLRDVIFAQLKNSPVDVRTVALCSILRANGGEHLADAFIELLEGKVGESRTNQLVRMFRAGASSNLPAETVWALVCEDEPDRVELMRRSVELVWTDPVLASQIPELVDGFVAGVLDGVVWGRHDYSTLGMFADVLSGSGASVGLHRMGDSGHSFGDQLAAGSDFAPAEVSQFLESVFSIAASDEPDPTLDLRGSPAFWSAVAEIARDQFGECWAAMSIAIRTAGASRRERLPEGADRLFDDSIPLCARARAARLRRGGPKWWLQQLEHARSPLETRLWVGLVLMWASASNVYALSAELDEIVESMSEDEFRALRSTLALVAATRRLRADRAKLADVSVKAVSSRTAVLIATAWRTRSSILSFTSRQERSEPFKTFLQNLNTIEELASRPHWRDADDALVWARRVADLRRRNVVVPHEVLTNLLDSRLRVENAQAVVKEPRRYPHELVARALTEVQRRYRPRPLATVSQEQDWVFE